MLNFHDDVNAFREFIREHQERVYNVVLKRVQSPEDAEEITQDVFVAVFRDPGAFRGESAVTTWLTRIAINKAIDHLRRKQGRGKAGIRFVSLGGGEREDQFEPGDFHHPGVISENREHAAQLFRAMRRLPEKQYTAWMLGEMEGMSYKEIGEVMKLSVASVESLLFRARQNLRKILADVYPGREDSRRER
jgi:RNA polymerase sigma-70 factor (ECF subfamily)